MGRSVVHRVNYLPPPLRPPAVRVPSAYRGPLAALLAAGMLIFVVCGIKERQVRLSESRLHGVTLALAASDAAVARLVAERSALAHQSELTALVRSIRAAGLAELDDVAWIGNRLPVDTILRALRFDAGGLSLEGQTRRIDAVATMMNRLDDPARRLAPALISISHDASARNNYRYTIRLERRP